MSGLTERVASDRFGGALGSSPLDLSVWTGSPGGRGARLSPVPLQLLKQTIEREIVPRLVLAHRATASVAAPRDAQVAAPPSHDTIVELADLAMGHDVGLALSLVETMHARGVSAEALYLELLAPTACYLGALWEDDKVDFTQVTIGLTHLHQVLRAFSPSFHTDMNPRRNGRRALLTAVPGEQHTFGLAIVVEFFRRAGWRAQTGPFATLSDLIAMVRSESFSIIGLSLGSGGRVENLATCIRSVRRASRNRDIGIMVGGPLFALHPELVTFVGADATSADGRQAPIQAQNLLDLLATRR